MALCRCICVQKQSLFHQEDYLISRISYSRDNGRTWFCLRRWNFHLAETSTHEVIQSKLTSLKNSTDQKCHLARWKYPRNKYVQWRRSFSVPVHEVDQCMSKGNCHWRIHERCWARPPPLGVQILSFSCSFLPKFCQKTGWQLRLTLPSRKSRRLSHVSAATWQFTHKNSC